MAEFEGRCGNCGRKVTLVSLEPVEGFDASEFCCGVEEKKPVTEPQPAAVAKVDKKVQPKVAPVAKSEPAQTVSE